MIAMQGRNVQMVGVRGESIVLLAPRPIMTREEAINLAAWLVALLDGEDDFNETLAAVEGVPHDA
jgi:hypothetical protein